jgi:hypothetical protein
MNVIIEIHVDHPEDLSRIAGLAVSQALRGQEAEGMVVVTSDSFEDNAGYRVTMAPDFSRGEIHQKEAMEISDEIGEEFRKGNGDYTGIAHAVEKKHGSGSIMLALRSLVGWVRREKAAADHCLNGQEDKHGKA